MAIDIEREELLTLTQAAHRIPGRPSMRTLWRWVSHGVGGRRLETIKFGGRRFTSREAIDRYGLCGTDTSAAPSHVRANREREIARAEAELREAGF